MSEAEDLLNGIATYGIDPESEPRIVVNEDRTVTVPSELRHVAVQGDHNVETVVFECPRYWDGHDFSKMNVFVNYMRPDGFKDSVPVKNLRVGEDDATILFDWTISGNVTMVKGNISFLVYIESDTADPCWHSRLCQQMIIDEGLTCTEQISYLPDSIEGILTKAVDKQLAQAYSAIDAKTQLALESIPEEYAKVDSMATEALRKKANAIILECEGEAVKVNDASDSYLIGLRLFGKTTQEANPTPDSPKTLVSLASGGAIGVTVDGKNLCPESAFDNMSVNGSTSTYDPDTRTITMTAGSTGNPGRYCSPCKDLIVGKPYTVSFDIRGSDGKKIIAGWDKKKCNITLTNQFVRYNATLVATKATEPVVFYSISTGAGGLDAGEFMQFANVQIEYGETATEYEPHKDRQTLSALTPNGLRGIPVDSGGNYTDAAGQQWICDEVDFERGVYVQRVFEETVGFSAEQDTNGIRYRAFLTHNTDPAHEGFVLCDKLLFNAHANPGSNGVRISTYSTNLAIAYHDDKPIDSATLLYPLAAPIETPLSDVEIANFKMVCTNYHNTTILNNVGAHMAVKYNADTLIFLRDNQPPVSDERLQAFVDAWLTKHFSSAEGVSF